MMMSLGSQVEVAMPKKRGAGSQKGYADATARFLSRTYEAVCQHVDFSIVRCLVIAGPGFTRDQFREYLLSTAQQRADKDIIKHKSVIISAPASSPHLQAIQVRVLSFGGLMNIA